MQKEQWANVFVRRKVLNFVFLVRYVFTRVEHHEAHVKIIVDWQTLSLINSTKQGHKKVL